MADVTKINISEEDLAQAYQSGFADGSIVRDKTVVSAEYHSQLQRSFTQLTLSNAQLQKDYERLKVEHNHLANSLAEIQKARCPLESPVYEDFTKRVERVLDELGEVSPF